MIDRRGGGGGKRIFCVKGRKGRIKNVKKIKERYQMNQQRSHISGVRVRSSHPASSNFLSLFRTKDRHEERYNMRD